ncbi:MAG: hypothetical protein IIZ93_01240 [Acidaminococcaceae bacterium]|nr:hypothetical protein [Acidaminococcaceae bacterium]
MAEEKNRPEVDGWTTSGYGLILNGKPVKPIEESGEEEPDIDEIEEV